VKIHSSVNNCIKNICSISNFSRKYIVKSKIIAKEDLLVSSSVKHKRDGPESYSAKLHECKEHFQISLAMFFPQNHSQVYLRINEKVVEQTSSKRYKKELKGTTLADVLDY